MRTFYENNAKSDAKRHERSDYYAHEYKRAREAGHYKLSDVYVRCSYAKRYAYDEVVASAKEDFNLDGDWVITSKNDQNFTMMAPAVSKETGHCVWLRATSRYTEWFDWFVF